ncbi:glutamate ABC transporter substrate-binding protein [Actinoallomurus rhizosphaericola]|uniref:glutamate ABC transporter substrate-binding protein n=1 Tax=Actinoallomurus rhizosphaericola TaxID=2952536 RepID=UPI002093470D|nr:glutamate ABC transporter substrate-binding protein [Actinoallomurus rhizosphaericola]MCO5998290.1 glutamate ABC transporter substrate-binding protein [Actinoallomurus rhizosphaericola]
MRLRRIGIAVTLLLASAGCGMAGGATASVSGRDHLVVGVAKDQPGLGVRDASGAYKGFDIDVARDVARRLGATQLTFKPVTPGQREAALRSGDVDMVVSSYSITQERKTQVVFAGPYYVAHQDILVRGTETAVRGVRDLRGRRLCQVAGSVSWRRVTEEHKIDAGLVPAASYGECLDDLISRKVDAISTDDLILAGFAAQRGNQVRFVNAPFSDERYGVGLRPGDIRGCEDVNKAITEMYQDGTAAKLLKRWFGSTGLNVTTTVPQFEGCG